MEHGCAILKQKLPTQPQNQIIQFQGQERKKLTNHHQLSNTYWMLM